MQKDDWTKIEAIVDEALSIKNQQQRKEYIKHRCESDEYYEEVAGWLFSIRKAKETGFLEW